MTAGWLTDKIKPFVPENTRTRIVEARYGARRVTAPRRRLPDFLIIGAMRCGTSSMYKYLSYNPSVAGSLRKETEYFTRQYGQGEQWYRAHFPLALGPQGRRRLAFEATPDYLFDPRAPGRAAALVPDARLVVMLRDPVSRAFSQYEHNVRLGLEQLSFADALDAEPRRVADDRERLTTDPLHYPRDWYFYGYAERGFYARQLRRWLDLYPRERLHVIYSDVMYEDPAAVYGGLLEFLGLPAWLPREFRNYSYVSKPPSRGKLDPDLAADLTSRYAESDQELTELLGLDRLPWR